VAELIDTVYFRYRRQEKDESTPEQNGHTTTREFVSARKY
jgi:hypothetical protein